MSLRVLVAPDKFKGTLTAPQAAGAIVNGWWGSRPQDEMEMLPISDGGDGFGEIMANLLGATECVTATVDAANRPVGARWWWQAELKLAIIEAAQVVGLAMLPPNRYHPFELDTRGLGAVIQAAVAAGAQTVYLGIGGSATNDGGFGMARALGWRFFDDRDLLIEKWVKLNKLTRWLPPLDPILGVDFLVAVDVENPMLGLNGCTRIYGPQKGILPAQFPIAEAPLERLALRAAEHLGYEVAADPGCGAAGGLGFGLRVFLGARMEPGFEIFARHSQIDAKIEKADVILTGEGMIDKQTLMGKGTGRLAQRCHAMGKRCVGFGGMVEGVAKTHMADRLFHSVHDISPSLTNPTEAKRNAALWLERLANKVAGDYDWS
ncbi:MAG: glycerate kinase [Verrucomicrobia bacterium]|nr:glycerate kinase [Verrucomicrobiota bacterium]